MSVLYTSDKGLNTGFDYSVSGTLTEIVSLADVTDRMNIETDEDDNTIANQIKAVRLYLEKIYNRTFLPAKTITAYWQTFGSRIPLPFPPITSITSVNKISLSDGSATLLVSGDDYWVEGVNEKIINMNSPDSSCGIKIVYVAGETDDTLISLYKDAIISEVMSWYLNRNNQDEAYKIGQIAMIKLAFLWSA